MTPEVTSAVEEIREMFADHAVEVTPEQQGGAYVIVQDLPLGDRFAPSSSWCGFLITFQYPRADVYPHFLDSGVKYADGSNFPTAITGPMDWQGRKALQVSRRSNRWDAAADTAAAKLAKVLNWLRSL